MKIQKIKLYKRSLVEVGGEYEVEITDAEEVPCVITNRALKMCEQLGVTKTSLISDIMSMSSSAKIDESGDMAITKTADDERVLAAIYVGYVGGQLMLGKNPDYDYDEFLNRYHADVGQAFSVYQEIIMVEENDFVKEINRSTKKVGTGEKKPDLSVLNTNA